MLICFTENAPNSSYFSRQKKKTKTKRNKVLPCDKRLLYNQIISKNVSGRLKCGFLKTNILKLKLNHIAYIDQE